MQRRRQLQNGTLVLLRARGEALAIGRVVRALRELTKLNEQAASEIGVTFDYATLTNLMNLQPPIQLVGLAGSFFAYEPVLHRLQKLQALPFREEFLGKVEESPVPEYAGVENILATLERQMQDSGIELDVAQQAAFEHTCSCCLALIVRHPGTKKSLCKAFCVAQLRKDLDCMLLVSR